MRVCAIYTCRDEVDIVEDSFRHMLAEGIEHIYVTDHSSIDGSRSVIDELARETGQITVFDNSEPYYDQVKWTNWMLREVKTARYDWVVPSDVDEFWHALDGRRIVDALADADPGVDKYFVTAYQHLDWERRLEVPQPWPKVVFRNHLHAILRLGAHDVEPRFVGLQGMLGIRELKYRSLDHFIRKVTNAWATTDPNHRFELMTPLHYSLIDASDADLEAEWGRMNAEPTVYDPIPTHLPTRSTR